MANEVEMKIEDADRDLEITGEELFPVSDNGNAKSVSLADVKDYTLAGLGEVESASSIDLSTDSVYVSGESGTRKVIGTTLGDAIISNAMTKAGIATPNGNEKFTIDDNGILKTITSQELKTYVNSNLSELFSGAANAGTLGSSDLMLVAQGGNGKKTSLGSVASFVMGTLASYIGGLDTKASADSSDEVVVVKDGVAKRISISKIMAMGAGDVVGPTETTEDRVPQWDSETRKLKNGLAVRTSVRAAGTADNNSLVTEAAVAALAGAGGDVKGPSTSTTGKIPSWGAENKTLADGYSVKTTIGETGADNAIPTEKAVRAAITTATSDSGDVKGPITTTPENIPQWDATQKKLKDGVGLATSISSAPVHTKIATEKAVKDAIDALERVKGPAQTTENRIPQWDGEVRKLKNGLNVTTSIGEVGVDSSIPTEKAVRSAINSAKTELEGAISDKVDEGDLEELLAPKANKNEVEAALDLKADASALASKGDVFKGASQTNGKLVAWDANGKVTDGKGVVTTIASEGSDENVPTEKAVRAVIESISGVTAPTTTTSGNVPAWDSTNRKLADGYIVKTAVGATAAAGDNALVTEKAVRQAVNEAVLAPSTHAEDAIPTWGAANELKAGKTVVTVLASNGSDSNIPTEKAVRDALPVAATTIKAGLMSTADKTKLDGLVNTSAVAEIGDNTLADADTVVVRVGDTTYKKALLTRFWAYIMTKLGTFKIDRLAQADDNTNLDASTERHGLCPKMDADVTHFLRGDGTWAEPTGSSDFIGTDGVNDGVHGLVPKPLAADANKFLKADGTWAETPAAAGVDIPGKADIGEMANDDLLYAYQASTGSYKRATMEEVAAYVRSAPTYDTLFIPAGAMTPSVSDGATSSALAFSNNTHDTAAFVGDADKSVEFNVTFPDEWDGGDIKVKVMWTCNAASAEAGQTASFAIGAIAFADGKNITDEAPDGAVISDSLIAVNYNHISAASTPFQVGGANPAGGNMIHFKMTRDTEYGTLGETVHVLGVLIQYRKDKVSMGW